MSGSACRRPPGRRRGGSGHLRLRRCRRVCREHRMSGSSSSASGVRCDGTPTSSAVGSATRGRESQRLAGNDAVLEHRLSQRQQRLCPHVAQFNGRRCEVLAQLCYPFTPAAFFRRFWRQRSLLVHGHPQRLEALAAERLHRLELQRLLLDSPSEEIHCWMTSRVGVGNESFRTSDPEAALAAHRAGASLYFRAPAEASELLVTAVSQQLGLSFGALHSDGAPRSEVETFVSRAGHVTHWHFDFMENFTLQLRGTKRWRLKPSAVEVPLRGCTPQWGTSSAAVRGAAEEQAKCHTQHASGGAFDASPPDESWEDAVEVELAAGSIMYFPAGMWHRVEAVDDSISINISIMGAPWADLVVDAIRQRLLCHTIARAPICMRSVADGRRHVRSVLALAQQELSTLTPLDLLPPALALPRAERVVLRLEPPSGELTLDAGAKYRRNPLAVLIPLAPFCDEEESDDESGEEEEEEEGSDVGEWGGDQGSVEVDAPDMEMRTGTSSKSATTATATPVAGVHCEGGLQGSRMAHGKAEAAAHGDGDGQANEQPVGNSRERSRSPRRATRRLRQTRCSHGERLTSASDLFVNGGRGGDDCVRFVLHSHFGAEDLASLLRVELHAPAELQPLMAWCCTAPARFSLLQAWRGAQHRCVESGLRRLGMWQVAAVLQELELNGFCRRRGAAAHAASSSL